MRLSWKHVFTNIRLVWGEGCWWWGGEREILLRYYFSISTRFPPPTFPPISMFTEFITFCLIPNLVKLWHLLPISVSQCWRITCTILHLAPYIFKTGKPSVIDDLFLFFRSDHNLSSRCAPLSINDIEATLSFSLIFLPISVTLSTHLYTSVQ